MNSQPQPDLPRMSILEGADKSLSVVVDGRPQDLPAGYAQTIPDPWQPARDLARLIDQCVFAELTDSTGERYTHVFDPDVPIHQQTPDPSPGPAANIIAAANPASTPRGPEPAFSISGDGFAPGEDVYIAVVVSTRTARADGVARLPLPGALLNRIPGVLIMFGLESQTLIVSDPTGEAVAAAGGDRAA